MVAQPIDITMRRRQMAAVKHQQREANTVNVITGDAKVIDAKMMQTKFPAAMTQFLSRLRLTTFGDQGFHRQAGEDEHFCIFDLAGWSHDMLMSQAQVRRTRERLVEAHVITFAPHPMIPGRGVVGWNMQINEWERIGPKGGNHNPVGNPLFHDPEYQAALYTLKAKSGALRNQVTYQSVSPDLSKDISTLNGEPVNMYKHDSLEVAPEAGGTRPQEKIPKRRSRSSDANASGGADATAASVQTKVAKRSKSEPAAHKGAKEPTDPAWDAVRKMGFDLLTNTYGAHGYHHGVEAGALVTLFRDYHIRSPDELRGVWESTLLDPCWEEERRLSMTVIAQKIAIYRRSPEGYRLNMRKKRERSNHNGNHRTNGHQPGHPENWKAESATGSDARNGAPEDATTAVPGADVEGASPEELAERYAGFDLF